MTGFVWKLSQYAKFSNVGREGRCMSSADEETTSARGHDAETHTR